MDESRKVLEAVAAGTFVWAAGKERPVVTVDGQVATVEPVVVRDLEDRGLIKVVPAVAGAWGAYLTAAGWDELDR